MKIQFALIAVFVIVLALAGCAPSAAPSVPTQAPPTPTPLPIPTPLPPPTPSPAPVAAVVMGAAERLNAGDLDGAMAYWADDAMFYAFGMPPTGSEIYRGNEQIRAILEENIASHFQQQVEISTVVGDIINARTKTWHDFTRQIGVAPMEATEVYQIRDGKIATYTWTLTEDSAVRLKTALAAAMPAEPEAAAPAATPVSELTVTLSGGTCSYEGPLTLQAGEVQVTMDVQDKQMYALTFFTLDPDKDFMDLMASTVRSIPPPWSDMFSIKEASPGKSETYRVTVTEGPVYVVCWSKPPELPIGNVGPFGVSE